MQSRGLTKTRSMGPVADLVRASGASLNRVFRRAELPLGLMGRPDELILLRDQLNLVECAAHEVGDPAFAPRLSVRSGVAGLGEYGQAIAASEKLEEAMQLSCNAMASQLQGATALRMMRAGNWVRWTYRVTEAVDVGRLGNEMLAMGYLLDIARRFLGAGWVPTRLDLPRRLSHGQAEIESVLGCEVSVGADAALVFPAELLDVPNPRASRFATGASAEVAVPPADSAVELVERLLNLAVLDSRPGIDWVCRRIGLPRRSLQRELAREGAVFETILQRCLRRRADALLAQGLSVTDTGIRIGYADAAHFSRAYRRWTGMSPRHHVSTGNKTSAL